MKSYTESRWFQIMSRCVMAEFAGAQGNFAKISFFTDFSTVIWYATKLVVCISRYSPDYC